MGRRGKKRRGGSKGLDQRQGRGRWVYDKIGIDMGKRCRYRYRGKEIVSLNSSQGLRQPKTGITNTDRERIQA